MEQLKEVVVNGHSESGLGLAADVARCAAGLLTQGCGAGQAVAILLRNCREQLVATLAAQHIGAYPVQMNWHSHAAELHYVLSDCGAGLLVAHSDLLMALDRSQMQGLRVIAVTPDTELALAYRVAPAQCGVHEGDVEWYQWLAVQRLVGAPPCAAVESIIYTSGTTGHPKGVRRVAPTPEQQRRTDLLRRDLTGIAEGARVLVPAPLYHTAPHLFAMRAVRKAEALVIHARFDAQQLLVEIERHRITHVYAVPTMFVRLLALPQTVRGAYDLSSLRLVLHAGGGNLQASCRLIANSCCFS